MVEADLDGLTTGVAVLDGDLKRDKKLVFDLLLEDADVVSDWDL